MKTTIKTFLLIFLCFNTSFATDTRVLHFEGVRERKFTLNGLSYLIKAKKKVIDYKKFRKIRLFNRKHIASQVIYYNDGAFFQKDIKVDFKKGFFYEGDFHMEDCFSSLENGYIKSKSAIATKDYTEYKDVFLEKNNKKYRKFKYKVSY